MMKLKAARTRNLERDVAPDAIAALRPNAGVGKRWRFRRNVAIVVSHRAGMSQRALADVFDLARSTIGSIVNEFSSIKSNPLGDSGRIPIPTPPPNAGVGKRWRFRRNVVIAVAYRAGMSRRDLADVFDLPRTRISAIIKEIF